MTGIIMALVAITAIVTAAAAVADHMPNGAAEKLIQWTIGRE